MPPLPLSFYELSVLAILLFTPLLVISCRRRALSGKPRLPPSPRGLPIIGNLHQLSSLPHRSLRELSEKHGPLMLLHMGRVPTLIVSSADAAREILKTHDLVFANRPIQKIGRILSYECEDLAFAPYGKYWRQVRKIWAAHLFSNRMVQSFHHMRKEEVAFLIDKVSSQAAAGGGTVDMSENLNAFSHDIISRVGLGKISRKAGLNHVFREMVRENSKLFATVSVGEYIPSLGWLDDALFGLTKRAERNRKRWDDVLDRLISECAGRKGNDDALQEGGLVSVLLALQSDPNMDLSLTKNTTKALLWDMFGAGTDTSYVLMEWTMAELVKNPEVMKKVQGEIRGIAKRKTMVGEEDLTEMRYLRAVLMEVLRLHPPSPILVPRESMEDCEINGYKIPKQTRVLVNSWAIGRDPKSWEAPEEFRPERFIGNPVDFKGNDYEFIPFGAGRRICPGMNFAVANTELALANLIHRFDWELPGGLTAEDMDMAEAFGISVCKKERLKLIAKPCAN
nr:cytochrome P450 family 71 subfamily DA polypeptide 12 [Gloriosa superba]